MPYLAMAASVSPPPAMENPLEPATASATARVPLPKASNSNTPTGPFHTIVPASRYAGALRSAGTIVWNGPVGVFEFAAFENGTRSLAEAIADSKGFSIAGGGDTLAAIAKYGLGARIGYISTGGGAFLEFLEGRKLPAVEVLEQRAAGAKKG